MSLTSSLQSQQTQCLGPINVFLPFRTRRKPMQTLRWKKKLQYVVLIMSSLQQWVVKYGFSFFFFMEKESHEGKSAQSTQTSCWTPILSSHHLLNVPSNGGQSPSYCSGQEEIRDQEGGAPSDGIIPPPTGHALRLVSYSHILRGRTGDSPRRPIQWATLHMGHWPREKLARYIWKRQKLIPKDTCTPIFTAAIFTVAKTRSQLSAHQQMNGSRCGTYKQRSITQP